MQKFLPVIAISLLSIVPVPALSGDPDTRQILLLNSMQRHHILSEMRTLLQGTQAILQSLAEGNLPAVARHARALGREMPHKGEDHLHGVLPEAFMKMGMRVHQGFDQLAADAESSQDIQLILKRLSDITQICTACHTTYQIRINPLPESKKSHREHHFHQKGPSFSD